MSGQDYARFTQRLKTLSSPNLIIEAIGLVNDYQMFRVLLGEASGERKNILITAGIHGDEPAGPEAALCFLERDNSKLLQKFRFVILPCVNPYGYAHNARENKQGTDINRSFAEEQVVEVVLFKKAIEGQRFDFYIDFHEDWEAEGFYLYEGQRDEHWIGQEIIENVEKVGQIDTGTAESDIPISKGVLKVDPAWGTAGTAPYMLHTHSDHVMICETPKVWPLEQRASAHLAALDTALKHYLKP